MSGISNLFEIGKSALFTAQRVLSVTGQNIANVNTPGYSRQVATLTEGRPENGPAGQIGTGVAVTAIQRQVNAFIDSQLTGSYQDQGRLDASRSALFQIQGLFNDTDTSGLSAALSDFFGALQDVANNPGDATARTVLLTKAGSLAQQFNSRASALADYRTSLDREIGQTIVQVNDLAAQIADRNSKIAEAEVRGQNANDLRDQRGELVNQLAQLIDVSTIEDSSGQLTVFVGRGQPLVAQDQVHNLVGVGIAANQGLLDVQFQTSGTASISIGSLITNGKLKGLLDARDTTIPSLQTSLDTLAAALAHEVNQLHTSGYGLDGSTGNNFFSPPAVATAAKSTNTGSAVSTAGAITADRLLTLHQYEIRFSAANAYSIVDTTTGGTIKGNYTGTAITAPSVDAPLNMVTGTNDTLTLTVDGTASGTITLTGAASPGQPYSSGEALAAEMQTQINADAALAAAGRSVTVVFDHISNRFLIMSNNTTSASAVNVTGGTARASLGLAAGLGTAASGSYSTPQSFNIDGITVTVSGTPAANDVFTVDSRTGAAAHLGVALTDPNKVAASGTRTGVPGDNTNAVALAGLQVQAIAGLGNVSFATAYSTAVTNLGASAQQADRDMKSQDTLQQQLEGFRAEVSGVSLDEELTNMLQYQRAYQAASRLIMMTDELLQDLLAIKQQ